MNLLPALQFQLCSNNTFHNPHQGTFLSVQNRDTALFFQSLLGALCRAVLHSQSNIHVREAIVRVPIVVLNQQGGMRCGIWRHYIASEEDFHQKKWLANE
jgi:hypothetical protein